MAEFLARNYAPLSREGAVIGYLAMLDRPMLSAHFVPRENGAWVEGTLRAERFHREASVPFEAKEPAGPGPPAALEHAGEPFPVFVSADELNLPKWADRRTDLPPGSEPG